MMVGIMQKHESNEAGRGGGVESQTSLAGRRRRRLLRSTRRLWRRNRREEALNVNNTKSKNEKKIHRTGLATFRSTFTL